MNAFARGARVLVLPNAAFPSLAGRTALVVCASHPEHPEAAMLSFDEAPEILGLMPNDAKVLAPFQDRPCLSLDPSCCMLAPCPPCLDILKKHMGAALVASSMTAEQGPKFVERWNAQRAEVRAQMAETLRQAREWLEQHPPGPMPAAEAVDTAAPPEPEAPEGPEIVLKPADCPQVLHTPDVEKNHVTPRRKRPKKDVPDAGVPKTPEAEASGEEGAVASEPGGPASGATASKTEEVSS